MRRTLLHLSLIPGVGPATVQRLCNVVGAKSLPEIYFWGSGDFCSRAGFSLDLSRELSAGLAQSLLLERELELIKSQSVSWSTLCDDDYPALLKQIQYPPIVLYWWGQPLTAFDFSVALVGSRKANAYGRQAIERLVPDFVAEGWGIVSGGALGADTMAHEITLDVAGRTCAIIGSGLLTPYPASNRRLFMRIREQGGSVVSPFPLAMQALPGNFPARNRIIAGMSRATVVIQAAEKSGALITAYFALEQGREVGAVPGPITDPLSFGCHTLLRDGAVLVSRASDIFQACGFGQDMQGAASSRGSGSDTIMQTAILDPVVEICREPQSFDEILERLDYTPLELQKRLVELQLGGVLELDFMGRWVRRL
ncbi:TPA: DNA-protecting protein DprA [Candidatus Dependentiae bacterium]|nr:MAG: protecting protein DprA protein [candidate division TM6 bacterium GW2011_GWF2_43_87]HBL98649.1 DNA-protecting protein DprA [Candidatus Dependentiae bacterium]